MISGFLQVLHTFKKYIYCKWRIYSFFDISVRNIAHIQVEEVWVAMFSWRVMQVDTAYNKYSPMANMFFHEMNRNSCTKYKSK